MPIVGEFLRQALDSLFSGGPAYFAVALALAGLGVLGRMYVNRKRISFEEDFNSKIGIVPFARQDDPATEILSVFNSVSVVVIRVWNSGRATVEADDYARALRFVVRDRYIVDFRLSEPRPDTLRSRVEREGRVSAAIGDLGDPPPARARQALIESLPASLVDPTAEQKATSRELALPRMEMRRGDEFRLVVCLREDELAPRNTETDKGYEFGGALKPGKIIDHDAPRSRFSATRLLSAAVVVLLVLLIGALSWRTGEASYCAEGSLRIVGSSAFESTVTQLSREYAADCGDPAFTIAMNGSLDGVRELVASDEPGLLAFSDGLADDTGPQLQPRPVALLVYAVVVNSDTGVQDLTLAQLRDLYAGRVRNWAEVGGADLPVRLVSRNSDSGSRRAFERTVLNARESLPVTSDSCADAAAPTDPNPVRCERGSTIEVLGEVDVTSGAIGYADAAPAADFPGLLRVRIEGIEPSEDYVRPAPGPGYPFWTVEYAYTRGFPASDSLTSRFVGYLSSEAAALNLGDAGYTPCVDTNGSLRPICTGG